jgi:hypothetical protein
LGFRISPTGARGLTTPTQYANILIYIYLY